MQMMPSLQVKQKQALVMTPQLQQAIKLLQMTNLDICNYLQEQALENPFLEVENGTDRTRPPVAWRRAPGREARPRTPTPEHWIRTWLAGSALADDPTANADLENRFGSEGLDFGHSQRGRPADLDWDALANLAEQGPESLVECVLRQIDLTFSIRASASSPMRSPKRWSRAAGLAVNCRHRRGLRCRRNGVEEVLALVQTLEPEGVFAPRSGRMSSHSGA